MSVVQLRFGLILLKTCSACPEQYEAYDRLGKEVGYFRLRHGTFRVQYPNVCGDIIYQNETKGDGIFEDDERDHFLDTACSHILSKMDTSAQPTNNLDYASMYQFHLKRVVTINRLFEETSCASLTNIDYHIISITDIDPETNFEDCEITYGFKSTDDAILFKLSM
jgi:hypothetical protein